MAVARIDRPHPGNQESDDAQPEPQRVTTAGRYRVPTPGAHRDRLGHDRITYAALDAAASRVANLLVSSGIQPGDKVALSCPNLPHFSSVYFGILKAGAVVVPLNVLLRSREIAYHLADSDAKAYVAFEGTPELPIAQAA